MKFILNTSNVSYISWGVRNVKFKDGVVTAKEQPREQPPEKQYSPRAI